LYADLIIVSPKPMNVIFQRLSFAIQKSLAAQLVARLPFIHMYLFYIYKKMLSWCLKKIINDKYFIYGQGLHTL
jgi:hypothetical protein